MTAVIINRVIYIFTSLKNSLIVKWRLFSNNVVYSSFLSRGVPYINTLNGSLYLGKNFAMNNGLDGNQIGYNTPCIFRCDNGNIYIGDNVGMSQTTIIAKGANINIGNYVKLGGGVKIYTSDFHSLDFQKRRDSELDKQDRHCADVNIGEDCFIGAGAIILKGVSIGARTIIGAGSVVTKSVPSDCIVAGNPARVVKHVINITESR